MPAAAPPTHSIQHRASPELRLAAALFAVLILAAALLFGAVDRIVQLGLVFGLAFGFLLYPPEVPRISRWWEWGIVAAAGFVVLSQFLPFGWFGANEWHTVLTHDYEVAFPFTRNPEPGRAFDCILMGFLAVAWFFWVRTLACDRGVRTFLIWAVFGTAACVAIVSMAVGTRNDYLIYGIRYSPGWTGFGPFPNRNHTAALLVMGALAGAGCVVRAVRRRYWAQVILAVVFDIAIVLALLESKSRGGLLGLCCGAGLFAVLAITKLRSRNAVAGAIAGGLLCATLVLSFGSKVLSRFAGPGDGDIPNNLRWQIWQNAIRVWQNAPLFGHGLGTFAQIFPIYQTVEAHGEIILHPESSWLLWLVELGAIPLALGALALLYFIGRNIVDAIQTGDRGYFIRAGAFAGVFGLLCHGLWDVPIHRWGTAAFGVALLAIACPPLHRRQQMRLSRLSVGVILLIAAYWLAPFMGYGPFWSPDALRQNLQRLVINPTAFTLDELRETEGAFPLSAELHEQVGLRELVVAHRDDPAWREFRIADRLTPGSWSLPALQAYLSRDSSAGMSFHFWSLAVERGDQRAADIFLAAYRYSIELPGGEAFWHSYAEGHPEFLLAYADAVPDSATGRAAYDDWWRLRGESSGGLEDWEAPAFYAALRKWGDPARLDIWMAHRPELAESDFKMWASILHQWRMDADAWGILSSRIKDPEFPTFNSNQPLQALETEWVAHPDDPIAAQAYARQCSLNGDAARSEQVILTVAAGKNPPQWFIEKAAFLYAARKDYATAVASLLRVDETKS